MEPGERRKGGLDLIWFPLYILWLELVCRFGLTAGGWDRGLLYTALFALALGLALSALTAFGPRLYRRTAAAVFSVLPALWASAQIIYFTIFTTFLTLYSVGNGAAALQFWRDILAAMGKRWALLALVWLPLLLRGILALRRRGGGEERRRGAAVLAWWALCCHLLAWTMVNTDASGALSPQYLYRYSFIPGSAVETFGLFTTLRLDLRQLLFGLEDLPQEDLPAPSPTPIPIPTPQPSEAVSTPEPVIYAPNVLDVDFAALAEAETDKTLEAMHQWFGGRAPTLQNPWTGAWKGKNLIFIVAEGFTTYAMTPETTPTLWKLSHEGFVCDEFYNPLWWTSTSDGEYVAHTSLIPKSGVWSFYKTGEQGNLMKFCLAGQLGAQGYSTRAYHDHDYKYYRRDISHPNLGYDYKGLGNGLEVEPVWPESDVEMMELTIPAYVDDVPFHTAYMTVSGHMLYTFMGNTQASKHRDEVGHEDLREEARAYLACQMELDQAMEYLIDALREAGRLEDTAIVLVGDHYPYAMDPATVTELVGHQVEGFETFRSTLILWSGDREGEEPVHITKPVCSLDILPTVSNLMALPYDSRLLMGRDALSDSPGLAVFSDRSYATGLGFYNAKTGTFTPREGTEVPEDYPAAMLQEVEQMFTNSARVLDKDYYRVLFGG